VLILQSAAKVAPVGSCRFLRNGLDEYKKADITSVRFLVESEKLEQVVEEFPKQLNACAKAWDRDIEHLQ